MYISQQRLDHSRDWGGLIIITIIIIKTDSLWKADRDAPADGIIGAVLGGRAHVEHCTLLRRHKLAKARTVPACARPLAVSLTRGRVGGRAPRKDVRAVLRDVALSCARTDHSSQLRAVRRG
jgi:hypothetical protein